MDTITMDFCSSILKHLRDDLNGKVVYEYYKEIDTLIIRIFFKDFTFNHALNHVKDIIYTGATDQAVKNIEDVYRKEILNAFFKSDERKSRDKMRGNNYEK